MRKANRLSIGLAAVVWVSAASAGDPSRLSEASELSATGAASIVGGSLVGLTGSAEVVVESVEAVGHGLKVALKGAAKVGRIVVLVPATLAGGASLAVGETVVLVANGAGWLITRAGEVVCFIPNEAGQALLYSHPASGGRP